MERKPFEQRFAALKNGASTWRAGWQEISDQIVPARGNFDDQPNSGKPIDYKDVIDGHAIRSSRTLAAGMTSGLTSPSRPWFKLGISDRDLMEFKRVKLWLNTVQERMMTVFSRSNIYGVLHSMYEELGGFGTASAAILEDYRTVIRGRVYTCGEYYLGVGPDGRVTSFAREYWFTVGQLISQFGYEKVSDQVKNLYQNHEVDKWVKVHHLIEPNDTRIPGRVDFKNMPYRSVYWERGSPMDTFLAQTGFKEFPILSPRWNVVRTSDSYGRGPGGDALGDARMLQRLQKDKLVALDKVINPPVQADSMATINTLPGGVSRYSGTMQNAGVKPVYQVEPDFQNLELAIQNTKNDISKTFYADLFLMLSQGDVRNMTAREVVERHEEKLLALGPVLERLEGELLDPLVSRTFNIMLRAGIVPDPPMELQGHELEVEYISILAQAQKAVGTTSIEQVVGFVGSLAGAFPDVLDGIDADEVLLEYAQMAGAPPKMIRSPQEIAGIRKAKQQALQQQQQAQQQLQTAQGAKLLSETKMGENSALDAVIKGAQGQAVART
jgi:hypothetical protein